jgi:hypothetical protein
MREPLTYSAQLEAWIRLAMQRASTLTGLVELLPGTYPLDVLNATTRMGYALAFGESEKLLITDGPIPHPVNSDWRLHPNTHQLFKSLVRDKNVESVALLGCPSLAKPLSTHGARLALVDQNQDWSEHVSGLAMETFWGDIRLTGDHLMPGFEVAIADPPWYPGDFEAFLQTAATLLREEGVLYLSWPAEGTRPGLAQEWQSLLTTARQFGLHFAERRPMALRYCTPFFEGSSLRAAGLPVLNAWRRSDLMVFLRHGYKSARVEGLTNVQGSKAWAAARSGFLDVRYRETSYQGAADPRLIRIVEGDVLTTVSRRDPTRNLAVVWTGSNRVFGCKSPDLFAVVLKASGETRAAVEAVQDRLGRSLTPHEEANVKEAQQQVLELEGQEHVEYVALHEGAGRAS